MKENARIQNIKNIIANKRRLKEDYDAKALSEELLNGSIKALSRAITLIESSKEESVEIGQAVLQNVLSKTGNSVRIGITGVPGVGKSTFIEAFGTYLTGIGKKLAVLAVDPSSERSKGSILGDKTRMEELSQDKNAFIRPSASSGSLGGVTQKTNETILLCEAAGFDVILVETVGVGQSETAVHQMTDFFLLLMLAGAGDELQGIKRGIMEMADALIITKADGDNILNSKKAASSYKMAMHLFPPLANGWTPTTGICSAIRNEGIEDIWQIVSDYILTTTNNNFFVENRINQREFWLKESFKETLLNKYLKNPNWQQKFEASLKEVKSGIITPYKAADKLIETL